MAEDGCDGGADGDVVGLWEAVGSGDALGEEDGDESLEGVEDEREDAETFGAGARDVGGSDVAAACGADVLFAKDANEEIPEGD
jgi:hypothetical protein